MGGAEPESCVGVLFIGHLHIPNINGGFYKWMVS